MFLAISSCLASGVIFTQPLPIAFAGAEDGSGGSLRHDTLLGHDQIVGSDGIRLDIGLRLAALATWDHIRAICVPKCDPLDQS